jgi:type IV secretory pathway component VirB8
LEYLNEQIFVNLILRNYSNQMQEIVEKADKIKLERFNDLIIVSFCLFFFTLFALNFFIICFISQLISISSF